MSHFVVVEEAGAIGPAGPAGPVDGGLDHRRRRELAAGDAPLVLEGGLHHRPAAVHLPEAPLVAEAHIVVEGGIGALGSHRLQGPDLDALGVEGHHEERQAPMFGHVGVGSGEQQHVVGHMGQRRPHLGAVDDPAFAVALGPGAGRGHVRARLGLAVSEAGQRLARQQPGRHLLAQVLVAVLQDHRHHHHGHTEGVGRRLVQLELLQQHAQLHRVHPAAAQLGRHRARQPAALRDGPVQGSGVDGAVAGGRDHLATDVLGQELPDLDPERLGPRRQREVHHAARALGPRSASASRAISAAGSPSCSSQAAARR